MTDPIDLATSQYQAQDLILASGLVPVGISIGEPKFPLRYTPVYMRRLAPWGLREISDEDEFSKRYRERLDAIGIAATQRRFRSISAAHDGRGLCLLCFEPAGAFCHRRVLASWIEEQTGQAVPELESSGQLRLVMRTVEKSVGGRACANAFARDLARLKSRHHELGISLHVLSRNGLSRCRGR